MSTRAVLAVFAALLLGAPVEAAIVKKTVSYRHADVELEGYLAYDDSVKGKRPGVLVVHEWWGLNDYVRGRVEQLAAMGYVAFGLDMYGKGKVTKHPEQASEWMKQTNANIEQWQQRALAGLEVLLNDPRTDMERIAAIGYCFGGATVQQLAYAGGPVKGVVSFHGSLVLPPLEPGKSIGTKILICHGAEDSFIKAETVAEYLAAMNATTLDWQMIIYGGAKHGFTNPGADQAGMEALAYDKPADRRSWEHMKFFLSEIFYTD